MCTYYNIIYLYNNDVQNLNIRLVYNILCLYILYIGTMYIFYGLYDINYLSFILKYKKSR